MTTWRERFQDARERKARGEAPFTKSDMDAWASCETCLLGEIVIAVFGREADGMRYSYPPFKYHEVNKMYDSTGRTLQNRVHAALTLGDVDEAERLYDAMEDAALDLKRRA